MWYLFTKLQVHLFTSPIGPNLRFTSAQELIVISGKQKKSEVTHIVFSFKELNCLVDIVQMVHSSPTSFWFLKQN